MAAAFPAARIEVADTTGGGDHFAMLIVSERFDGMPSCVATASCTTRSGT